MYAIFRYHGRSFLYIRNIGVRSQNRELLYHISYSVFNSLLRLLLLFSQHLYRIGNDYIFLSLCLCLGWWKGFLLFGSENQFNQLVCECLHVKKYFFYLASLVSPVVHILIYTPRINACMPLNNKTFSWNKLVNMHCGGELINDIP